MVDPAGRRFPVFGLVGRTLAEAIAGASQPELEGSTVHLSPRHGPEGHVRVAHEFARRMPPLDAESQSELYYLADDVAEDSRLASKARAAPARAAPRAALRRCAGSAAQAPRRRVCVARSGRGRGRTRAADTRVAGRVRGRTALRHAPKRLGPSSNADCASVER